MRNTRHSRGVHSPAWYSGPSLITRISEYDFCHTGYNTYPFSIAWRLLWFQAVRDAETHATQLKDYLSLHLALSTCVSVLRQPKGILLPSKENPWKYHNETWPIQFSFAKELWLSAVIIELWIIVKSLSLNLKMAANRERSFNLFSHSETLPMTLFLLNGTRVIKSLTTPWRALSQFGLSWSPLKEYWLNL